MIDLKLLSPAIEKFGKEGMLLTSGKKPNSMVISWGSVGMYWGEPVFIAPVRMSRYTRELIDASGYFSIAVPSDKLLPTLKVFGKESGRDGDKYQKTNINPIKCKSIPTYTIEGAMLTIECQIIAEMEIDADTVSEDIRQKWYDDDDYHIMYYGKIVNIY